MIRPFPGVDLGRVIMGLHWAHGGEGGHVKGAEQRPLAELGLEVLGYVASVWRVLFMVGECGRGRAWCGVVGREAELYVVHKHRQGDAPLAHKKLGRPVCLAAA